MTAISQDSECAFSNKQENCEQEEACLKTDSVNMLVFLAENLSERY